MIGDEIRILEIWRRSFVYRRPASQFEICQATGDAGCRNECQSSVAGPRPTGTGLRCARIKYRRAIARRPRILSIGLYHECMGKRRTPRYRRDAEGRPGTPSQPSGRIPADLSKQAPNNSYSPPLFYDDSPFICVDCGKEENWTAKQQQWWYEVAKGSIYSRAIRCRVCRRAHRAKRKECSPAENQPIRHVGTLMKLVRTEIEPAILASGFVFEARSNPRQRFERTWIDYKRGDLLFSFAFERPPRLTAELLGASDDCRIIALTEFDRPRNRADIMATIKSFASAVTEFMANARLNP